MFLLEKSLKMRSNCFYVLKQQSKVSRYKKNIVHPKTKQRKSQNDEKNVTKSGESSINYIKPSKIQRGIAVICCNSCVFF